MAEYVDKNALRDALYDADAITMQGIRLLNQFPAADVEPVRHGKWIVSEDEYRICATEFTCSNCEESYCTSELTDEEFLKSTHYCPNCGAKMGVRHTLSEYRSIWDKDPKRFEPLTAANYIKVIFEEYRWETKSAADIKIEVSE